MQVSQKIKKVLKLFPWIFVFVISPVSYSGSPTPEAPPQSIPISSLTLSAPVSYADAVALAAPAVVSIKTTKEIAVDLNPLYQDPVFRYFFGFDDNNNAQGPTQKNAPNANAPKEISQGLGSGVIMNEKGYILTNNHVIRDTDSMIITLADGRTVDAKVVGTDPDTDLAVIKINLDKLPVIPMGSSKNLRAGDVVLAIGDPFGLDKTVTQGIVSAISRTARTEIGLLENLIQIDAAINPGNSGGALIDSFGRLVGINTAIYTRNGSNQGISFAIPIDQATEIMNQLIAGKPIVRGYLGVVMQPLTKEIREQIHYETGEGVYIRAVIGSSPAQKAGLLPGDVLLKINNTPVKDSQDGSRLVSNLAPGKNYSVEIFRKGDLMTFSVFLGERKPGDQAKVKNLTE